MNISKTSGYALRLLSYMAHSGETRHTATQVNKDLGIPHRYLRKLLTRLAVSGFIITNKGKGGGFSFAKATDRISLADVVESIEGTEAFSACFFGFEKCMLAEKCLMHDRWTEARMNILNILRTTTIADITVKNKNPN